MAPGRRRTPRAIDLTIKYINDGHIVEGVIVKVGVSRWGDGALACDRHAGAFVILPLFFSRDCPHWSSTRSETPALS
jgi:hypothetical protein